MALGSRRLRRYAAALPTIVAACCRRRRVLRPARRPPAARSSATQSAAAASAAAAAPPPPDPVPITLITGYLGAGKTTLVGAPAAPGAAWPSLLSTCHAAPALPSS